MSWARRRAARCQGRSFLLPFLRGEFQIPLCPLSSSSPRAFHRPERSFRPDFHFLTKRSDISEFCQQVKCLVRPCTEDSGQSRGRTEPHIPAPCLPKGTCADARPAVHALLLCQHTQARTLAASRAADPSQPSRTSVTPDELDQSKCRWLSISRRTAAVFQDPPRACAGLPRSKDSILTPPRGQCCPLPFPQLERWGCGLVPAKEGAEPATPQPSG